MVRLTPAIIGLTIIHLTLGKYFGSGPNWSRIYNHVVIPCEKTWWESLLYIQNYVNIDNPVSIDNNSIQRYPITIYCYYYNQLLYFLSKTTNITANYQVKHIMS